MTKRRNEVKELLIAMSRHGYGRIVLLCIALSFLVPLLACAVKFHRREDIDLLSALGSGLMTSLLIFTLFVRFELTSGDRRPVWRAINLIVIVLTSTAFTYGMNFKH